MKYNTALTLSHHLNIDGSLNQQTEDRVKKGMDLYFGGLAETLTMSGGPADNKIPFIHAEVMKTYALQRDIPAGDIYLEKRSLDTVGQAIFSKRDVIVPKRWANLIVISNDYHLERVKKIFSFIYGKEFDIDFEGLFSGLHDNPDILKAEKNSLVAFMKTFEGVTPGNDDDIFNALVERHSLYKNFR